MPRDNTNEPVNKAIRMDAKLAEGIKQMAENENRNFSNMVTTILQNALDDYTTKKVA